MPLFIDSHSELTSVTSEAIREAHQRDLALQDEYGVTFRTYWLDAHAGQMFCLVDAPTKEAVYRVHYAAHRLLPNAIYEVTQGPGAVDASIGREPAHV